MATFTKRPIHIEARQYVYHNAADLADWMLEYGVQVARWSDSDAIGIPTLEGIMRASVGDWIIRGVRDEFYPCKPGIFEDTYEEVVTWDSSTTSGTPCGPTSPPTSSGAHPDCGLCTAA